MANRSRRKEIIGVAAGIFKQKGYGSATMRELADAVGLEAASLYNHIRSKEDILEEICFSVAHEYVEQIGRIEDLKASNIEKLRELISLHVRMIIQCPHEVSVANSEWRSLSSTKKDMYKQLRKGYEKRVATLISDGICAGEFKELNVSVALFTLLSSLRWIELWYRPDREVSPEELENDLMTILVEGFQR